MTESTHVAGWTLVSFLWQGALIAAAAAIALRLASRAAASTRYAIACAALATMLAAPVTTVWWLQGPDWVPAAALKHAVAGPVASSDASANPIVRTMPAVIPADATRWFPLLVAVWLVGVAVLTARTAWGWLRIRQLHHGALAAPSSRWQATANHLAASLGIHRRVHVADCDRLDAPVVIGWVRPVVLVPVAALSNLTISQVDAILAHELAHIRRHDYLVNLFQTVAETLLFYHPAVWWLSGRLRLEREHCCDDVAVSISGDAVGYAEALAAIEARRSAPAFAMAAGGGSLVGRIRRILGVSSPSPSLTGWIVAPVLAGVLALGAAALAQVQPAAPAAPRTPAAPSAPAPPADNIRSSSDVSSGRELRMQTSDLGRKLDIRGRGGLTFSDDLTDIVAMDDGAYLTIRDRNWFTIRSMEIRGERGAILRRFSISGVEQPWDPEGRQWLADRLPSLVRRSGLAVESRTRRILSTSGVNGVLEEITLLESDYVRRLYYRELLRTGSLDAATVARVVARAGGDIRSDYELRQTLEAAVPMVAADPVAVRAYIEATASMSSGFEHRQALDALADADGLTGGAAGQIAHSAARIRSDFEKRQALSQLLGMRLDGAESARAILDAAATIGSDYECATFLVAFVEAHPLEGAPVTAFFDAVGTIGSDYERGRVLKAVARRKPLQPAALQGVFAAVRTMQSDFEQAQVLLSVVKTHDIDAASRPAFLAAADTIHSEFEQTRVLAALVRAEPR